MSKDYLKQLALLKQMEEKKAARTGDVMGVLRANSHLNSLADLHQAQQAGRANERTWFQKGAFEDGYQFGDVTKTILGTTNDISENVTTAVLDATENLIDTTAFGVGAIGGLFDKGFQDKVGEFIAKEPLTYNDSGAKLNNILNWTTPVGALSNLVTGGKTEENSVLGDKSDGLVQSGAHLVGSKALSLLGVPSELTMGVNAFGSEIENAYKNGASHMEAWISASVATGAEIIFEKLSGGVKFSGSTADEAATKALSRNISNRITRSVLKWLGGTIGEGTEEVLTDAVTSVARKLTYEDEKAWSEVFTSEDALDAFVGGVIIGGIADGGNAINSATKGIDHASGLTKAEEAVVRNEYDKRVAEKTANGEKLGMLGKNKVWDSVIKDMENGFLSTDAIEAVLGGESYQNYKNMVDGENALAEQEAALTDELNAISGKSWTEMTGEEWDRMEELQTQLPKIREQIEANKTNSTRDTLKEQVRNEVRQKVQGSKLAESYLEQDRARQALQADTSQYKSAAAKQTVKNAIEGGMNNQRRSHLFLDRLAKISEDTGIVFQFTNSQKLKDMGYSVDGAVINGFASKDGITLNLNSKKAINTVVGHELTHFLEGTPEYDALVKALKDYVNLKGEGTWDSMLAEVTERYKNVEADPEKELVADLVGDLVFTDQKFVEHLSTKEPGAFKKLFERIKYLTKTFAGTEQGKQLEKVKQAFAEAWKAQKNTAMEDGVKYSLYSRPDFSQAEWSIVNRRKHREFDNPKYDLDENRKWMYAKEKGLTVFAVYSKMDADDPTVLYGSRGEKADQDYTKLNKFFEEWQHYATNNRSTFDRILSDIKSAKRDTSNGVSSFGGREAADGDVHLPLGESGSNRAGDYVNGAENLGKETVTEYNEEASDDSGASSLITFSNDYATIRNFMKDGDAADGDASSGTDARYSLSNKRAAETDIAPVDGWRVYGKDLVTDGDIAPVREDLAPVETTTEELEDITPVREDAETNDSTKAITKPINSYPAEKQAMMRSYLQAVDEKIKSFVQSVKSGDLRFRRQKIAEVSQRAASDIGNLLGIDVSGYTHNINTNGVQHILKRHGENGKQNQMMSIDDDIARIGWVLDNYDSVELLKENGKQVYSTEFLDQDHEPAPQIRFTKKIDGTYYVVEAAFENDYKKMWVQSAYLQKKEDVTQTSAEGQAANRETNARSAFASPSSNNSIAQTEPSVNASKVNNQKVKNIQAELANNRQMRAEADSIYEEKIAKAQAELATKKNKDSKTAQVLKRRIERLKRLKADINNDYSNRINNLERKERLAREGKPTSRQEHQAAIIAGIKSEFARKDIDFDEVLKKAKRMHTITINDNTPQRVNDKTFGYEAGEVLNDLTFNKVALNETEGIKWLNSFTDRKNGLLAQISKQYNIKPGSKASAAAQMYAEGFYVNEKNEIIAYGDSELAKDFPDATVQKNIRGLARDPRIRKIYDDTLAAINESRTRNAYPAIPRLDNYFLHFRAMEDTFSKLGLPFNPNDIKAKDLPTDMNGVTADLKPGQPYFASAMHRTGKRTSFDLLGGLEKYLTSAKNQIYHIDDIQTVRALRNYIAETYGQAHGLEGLDSLGPKEQADRIREVYDGHLSNYAAFLNEYANNLAGKTALMDRALEGLIGRRGLQVLNTFNSQAGKNQVGFSVSSAGTNIIPLMEVIARVPKFDVVKALAQTVSNKFQNDGFVESDPALVRRRGAAKFNKTLWEKGSDAGYVLMSAVDNLTSEIIVRAKYNELTRKGMDSEQAHIKAGEWAMRVMGDRSYGQLPMIYNSKTLGFFTKYQLELRNMLDSQHYDMIQEAKASTKDIEDQKARNAKTAARIASTTAQIAIFQHLFGAAYEKVVGYNPTFDIISTIATLFGWNDDEDDEDTFGDNVEEAFQELLDDLPYTNLITGGGRIPMSDVLPVEKLFTNEDEWGNPVDDGEWGWLVGRAKTIGEALPYALPGGYGQIKKTAQGLSMFSDEYPIAGSYTDSGELRFPVEENFGSKLQAALFGQWASENAREYFDEGHSPLTKKQTQELIDADMSIQEYWDYREGLKEQKTVAEKFDYIDSLDLSTRQKNILVNNIVDRKEDVDMTNYDDFGSYEEFDFAIKNPGKYAVAQAVGGYKAYAQYANDLKAIKADKDENGETISGSRKEKVLDYINSLDLEYGMKLILYKSQYKADDTYNKKIIKYLDGREDISYEDMVTILTELEFTVSEDGRVTW